MSGMAVDIMWIGNRRWSNKLQRWLDDAPANAGPGGGYSSPPPPITSSAPVAPAAGARGWIRPWTIRQILADVVSAHDTETATTGTAKARVIVPDPNLVVGMTLGFEMNTPGIISSYNTATWSATLVRPGRRDADLHALWTTETLPQGRSVSGLVGDIALSAAMTIPTSAGTGAPGQWVLEVTFKAAVPMCPEDEHELYAACLVKPVKTVVLLVPGI